MLHTTTALALLLGLAGVAKAQTPVGEVFAADSSLAGSVLYAGSGTRILSGSQVVAGARPALLKLTRGGEIRICPNTSIAVTSSPSGRTLLFSVNDGDVEFHFDAVSEGDALQTPDFRIQFAGPGRFDTAICTNKRGDLFIRGKTSSRAAVVVSEMLGDGVYQVPAGTSLDFKAGSVRDPGTSDTSCGCPEPPPSSAPPVSVAEKPATPPEVPGLHNKEAEPQPPAQAAVQPPETHVQVDAPFVYRGDEIHPEIMQTLAKIQLVDDLGTSAKMLGIISPPKEKPAPPPQPAQAQAEPPRPPKKPAGFFKKLGSFFGKMFGR